MLPKVLFMIANSYGNGGCGFFPNSRTNFSQYELMAREVSCYLILRFPTLILIRFLML